MRVLLVRKAGRLLTAVVGVVVVLAVVAAMFAYGREYRSARVDRSNAMQVIRPVPEQIAPAVSDFYTEYRLERDRVRSERSDLLREALKNAKTEESRQKAQDAVLKLVLEKQRESEMENLIKAKGFADALVFVRDNAVSAVVKTHTLNRDEVMQVADVIGRVSGAKPEDITISAKP
ncbi:SpoIIIAH-like family protein [Anaeroselena agilis]|uniref:SpoIIIAH-like family protein n=1 Tax=Anaeroselena agilis TaxID=3063788 RepID=A0ABU3NW69_9FIRM|nr:SpoIIIAH-like family protein [Selenomonadales bacterium 4137-cl]